jgi:hypothetical protein
MTNTKGMDTVGIRVGNGRYTARNGGYPKQKRMKNEKNEKEIGIDFEIFWMPMTRRWAGKIARYFGINSQSRHRNKISKPYPPSKGPSLTRNTNLILKHT